MEQQEMCGSSHLEGWLAHQTLVDDGSYAPQISLGIVVLGHDDLWGLGGRGKGDQLRPRAQPAHLKMTELSSRIRYPSRAY